MDEGEPWKRIYGLRPSAPHGEVVTHAERVTIVDINIPFWSLVRLLVELSLAAIPAGIIIAILYFIFAFVLSALGMSLLHH